MLQRAASNAYSWWMASHIRTNQSKWLDSDLQEMEDRVQAMLKIVEEDADSFAKRAEMYYKRRPELINYVEETYRAYRALAERYDRISGELHKANHTLATAFPDLQFPMQDEDDDGPPPNIAAAPPWSSTTDQVHRPPPPEFPQISLLKKRSDNKPPLKKTIQRLKSKAKALPSKPASHMTEGEANEAIDKLQKGILVLQTEKEFIKSSYEGGIAKYWEIEKRITEMQEEVTSLQDEFGASAIIDDDEARSLMVVTALKSCKDSLSNLQEQQRRSIQETNIESERLRTAREKLRSLEGGDKDVSGDDGTGMSATTSVGGEDVQKQTLELQSMCDKFKEQFEINSDTSVVELAEKIDELVDKVISLELTVSSQTAQIQCLRSETDDIQKHLRGFEEERVPHSDNSNDHRLKRAEEVQVEENPSLPRKVPKEKSGEEEESVKKVQSHPNPQLEEIDSGKPKEEGIDSSDSNLHLTSNGDLEAAKSEEEEEEAEDASLLLLNGSEGREKILLAEYTSILRSYRETKRKLHEVEKKNQEYFAETMVQVKELKNANAVKDDEIRSLRQILSTLQKKSRLQDSETSQDQLNLEASNKRDTYGGGMKPDCSSSDEPQTMSLIEEKFRRDIDTLLDENLQFWLRFCTSFHQIQRFREEFQTLQGDVEKLKDGKAQEGSSSSSSSSTCAEQAGGAAVPADKQLRELKTELQVWVEQNGLLRGELQSRFSSLCEIQEEITGVLKATAETDFEQFTPYQAAKFQGEVLNMKQENNKVADELQAGLDHVKSLQSQVEETLSTLSKLHEKIELSSSKSGHHHSHHFRHFSSKSKGVPLRSFLYGAKPKKPSIFSCMNPVLHKQYSDLRAGMPI